MVNSAAGGTDSTSRRINKARRGSTVRWSRACARRTTSFPCPSALGTAFNDLLYFLIGQADGREGRAINNLRNHVTQNQYGDGIDYWSPTINMQRDPRWGRNQEVGSMNPRC